MDAIGRGRTNKKKHLLQKVSEEERFVWTHSSELELKEIGRMNKKANKIGSGKQIFREQSFSGNDVGPQCEINPAVVPHATLRQKLETTQLDGIFSRA